MTRAQLYDAIHSATAGGKEVIITGTHAMFGEYTVTVNANCVTAPNYILLAMAEECEMRERLKKYI